MDMRSIEKFRYYAVFMRDSQDKVSCNIMIGAEIGSVLGTGTSKIVDIVPFPARLKWLDKLGEIPFMDLVNKLNLRKMFLKVYLRAPKRVNAKKP